MESQNKGGNFYQVQTRPHCNRCAFHCPSFPLPTPYGVATPYNPQQLNPYQQQRINSIRSALRNAQAAQTQEPAATQRHPTAVRQAHPHNPPNRFNTFPQHTQRGYLALINLTAYPSAILRTVSLLVTHSPIRPILPLCAHKERAGHSDIKTRQRANCKPHL